VPNHGHLFDSETASGLMKDAAKLEQLRDAPETQKIFSMLSQSVDGSLEQAADAAAKGDSSELISAIRKIMQNPEGARLIRQMKDKLK